MEYSENLEDGLLSRDQSSTSGIRKEPAAASSYSAGKQELNVNDGDELEYLTVDNMLLIHVGEFGWAQFWHFVLVCSSLILTAMYNMVMIFSDRVPEWRCVTQSEPGAGIQQCTPSSSICHMDRELWEWVRGRSATTASEWNLICGEEYKAGLVGSLYFVGQLVGGGIWGNMSDSFLGRKGTFTAALISGAIVGLLTAFAPNFWLYALMRFLTGVSSSGISQCTFVLATEVIGPTKRSSVGMSTFYFFSIGVMILPVFGYFATSWRVLYLSIALINVVYCILAISLLHESPRWYLVKGRVEDAMVVLRSFAKWNGKAIPAGAQLILDDVDIDTSEDTTVAGGNSNKDDAVADEVPQEISAETSLLTVRADSSLSVLLSHGSKLNYTGTLVDVFRCKETRRRMLIMICVWFSSGIVYYGISVNVANVGFNLYVSVFVNGLIEMPALIITAALSGRLGRRAVQVGSMGLSGVCCLLGSLLFINLSTSKGLPPPAAGLHLHSVLNPMANVEPYSYYYGQFSAGGSTFLDSNISSSSSFLERVHQYSILGAGQVNLLGILRLACGALGLFGMAGSYNVIYLYTTELFPTVVRNAVLGVGVQAAGIGAVGGPAIAVLGRMFPSVPFVIFGLLGLIGAALASKLPETLGQPLWDTMEGMERAQSKRKESMNQIMTSGKEP